MAKSEGGRTPRWTIDRLIEQWSPPAGRRWIDPCAGVGGLVEAFNAVVPNVEWTAVEPRAFCRPCLEGLAPGRTFIGDALDYVLTTPVPEADERPFDVVAMHPPHLPKGIAEHLVQTARRLAPTVVALMRLDFLAARKRRPFFDANLPHEVYVLPDRFAVPGRRLSESDEHAWMVWHPGAARAARLSILNLTPPEDRRR